MTKTHLNIRTALHANLIEMWCQGEAVLTCGGDGVWVGAAPSCVPRPCAYLQPPPHAVLAFRSHGGYDQVGGALIGRHQTDPAL